MERQFKISGMHCAACAAGIEKFLARQEGVAEVSVNLATEKMRISFDEALLPPECIPELVSSIGYDAEEYVPGEDAARAARAQRAQKEAELRAKKRRVILAVCFAVPLMWVSMGHMLHLPLPAFCSPHASPLGFALTQFVLTLPVLIAGRAFYLGGFPALFRGRPNMDSLVALGTACAFLYSLYCLIRVLCGDTDYASKLVFEGSAVVVTLVMLGKYLEGRSTLRTSEAIRALTELSPDTALVLRQGKEAEIPAAELQEGDPVVVLPGGRFPCDGVVTEGLSAMNNSMLTGESVPVELGPGSEVTGGAVNADGRIVFTATKVGAETALSHIIQLVEDAQAKKAPIAALADKIAGVFVPVVLGIAFVAALCWALAGKDADFVLNIFVSVLVIACPCSLGLATPTAILCGTGRGAEKGILYKSGEALQRCAAVSLLAADKTGTLTEGHPVLKKIVPAEDIAENELLRLCAAVEKGSSHPVGEAIVQKAEELSLELPEAAFVTAIPGRGAAAVCGKTVVLIGSAKLMEERKVPLPDEILAAAEQLADEGCILMYAAFNNRCAGVFGAVDALRPSSREAVEKLHKMGVKSMMLTGDNPKAAQAIAAEAGIDDVRAGVLPEDKANIVQALTEQGERPAMCGDGINDAPALAAAYVGIAVGSGTDVAIESADVVLMNSGLTDAADAIRLSRAVMRNIKENLFWAFFYNCIGIPFAAGVFYAFGGPLLNPMFCGAAMALSSICVVSNALRLRKWQ